MPSSASDDGSGTLSKLASESIVHCGLPCVSTINEDVSTENPFKTSGTVEPLPAGLAMEKDWKNELSGVRTRRSVAVGGPDRHAPDRGNGGEFKPDRRIRKFPANEIHHIVEADGG